MAGVLVGSAVHHPVAGRSSVVRSEREEVLLLENNSRATRRCSNNIKKEINRQSSEVKRQREKLQRLKQQLEY